ncbi:MAG: amidohydrolase family protein [Bryobacter sp.]|nr:amidohydrolase family protein [Bryobacter sp.]
MRAWIVLCLPLLFWGQAAPYDLIIHNARVVDGTGSPWYYGDLAVSRGKIARLTPRGMLAGMAAQRKIDARGELVLSPGFIDIQSHSRDALLRGDGRVISKISQGVTTEIMGEGSTNAPANEKNSTPGETQFSGPHSFAKWLNAMKAHGSAVNFGSFVGQATLRAYAKGMAGGVATAEEIQLMQDALREAMEDGAFGLASALIYPPGSYSNTEELIAVAKAMAPYGGTYITHMRSEADDIFNALDEAIRIGQEAKVPVELYHLKMAGINNWPRAKELVEKIQAARDRGVDLSANMYPYTAGGTGLSSCLPPWAAENNKMYENLANPETRARMAREMTTVPSPYENLCAAAGPEGVMLLGLRRPVHKKWAGKRLADVVAETKQSWPEAVFDLLLVERQRIFAMFFLMSEENIELKLRQPWMKIGTDAAGQDPDKATGLTHPRSYGTFPTILGKYVRERKVMPLEEAVRKMTSATALRLQIHDRGLLRPGFAADLVLFDPETIGSPATYTEPHQLSTGIAHVFVNGVAVWENGKATGELPGEIVKGPGVARPSIMSLYDKIYLNAKIVDGTGAGWFYGDLAVRNGQIARIALPYQLQREGAVEKVDLKGERVISPGFIDIQSHSREALTDGDARLISKVAQGITTEIMGEGWTNAPANAKTGGQADGRFTGAHSFRKWLETMAARGPASNFGSFVGAGTIRAYGKGYAMGEPTAAEMAAMEKAVAEAMEDGAFGLASALIYPPGSYASTAELTRLAKVAAQYGGTYISHIRSEADKLLEALEEAAAISHDSGAPAEIYHLKAAGRKNWDALPKALEFFRSARGRGIDIQANMYPYEASGTGLTAMLPDWAAADGKLFANLDNPATRAKILAAMRANNNGRDPDLVQPLGLNKPENQKFRGKRLDKIAQAMGLEWPEAVVALLRSERSSISTIYFTINETNIERQLTQPWMKVSTDAGGVDPAKGSGGVHPRTFGTYPRVLGYYVRERKLLPLEDAVFKMTGAVATRLHLADRGILRPGMAADLVVFDPATVKDRATFEAPRQMPVGIDEVVVNGITVMKGNQPTGAKAGKLVVGPGAKLR